MIFIGLERTSPLRITIVVLSYNQAQFLPHTLESIFNQNYQDIEVIVMDGGLTDGSVDVLKAYQDERLSWESKPDKGIVTRYV